MLRPLAFSVAATLILIACGSSDDPTPAADPTPTSAPSTVAAAEPSAVAEGPVVIPLLVSSEFSPGENRFLFSILDRANQLVAAPDVSVDLQFYDSDVDPDTVAFEADSRFLWALEDVRGLYIADVEFPTGGRWGTRFNVTFPDGSTETVRADYDVLEESWTPAIGAPAPSVHTPTAAAFGGNLAMLSSDPEPDPRFYETSVADALESNEPFVLVFATPAFCETATCGPTLELVKEVAAEYPDLTFINVEPYVMDYRDGRLQPALSADGQLQPAQWSTAWNLITEPYIFFVDETGTVSAKYEGAFDPDELREAIDTL